MRESGEGSCRWFSVDAKTFEISVEGERRKLKGFVKERRKGLVHSIRFGEGLKTLLKRVEIFCKECSRSKRIFEWKENCRAYGLDNRENEAGSFLLCFVTDGEGKRHKLFIPEGRGFLKGWTLLAVKLRGLMLREKFNVGECMPRESLGTLKYCSVGSWKDLSNFSPFAGEVQAWAKVAWRLEGDVMGSLLNNDLLFMEFLDPIGAKWVLEAGRWFRGGIFAD